jgi:hypothetical protein
VINSVTAKQKQTKQTKTNTIAMPTTQRRRRRRRRRRRKQHIHTFLFFSLPSRARVILIYRIPRKNVIRGRNKKHHQDVSIY